MELRQLSYFVAVCDELSFSRAAQRRFISQSAVSHQIRRLEHELGVALFERSTRSVSVTDAGSRLLPIARQMIELEASAHAAMKPTDRRIRLAANMSFARQSLSAISGLRDAHPEAEVDFVIRSFGERMDSVVSGDVDVALIRGTVHRPDVDVRQLWVQDLVIATAVRHPLAGRATVTLRELAQYPLVLPPPARQLLLRNVIGDAFATAGLSPSWGAPIPPDHTAAAELVNHPDAWTVLYDDVTQPGVAVMNDADGLLAVPVCAVTRRGRQTTQLLGELVDRLAASGGTEW
ncbi:LysR family transcriptional regulator [Williamsia sterculiae]|uniref:DNA-binding transcriptional regulator, LysR family n=1 Tax=Williamsia sterculiae TaxID=1344003 RepID=A0A1N7F2V8_9NOCA|nr:LysR family transcriptional regulator [Williamsia sterculiae]SIR94624.1 DNA-binding transcriptional regulator, LysR family [Williamsia sterculiae]